ncbi:MAG: aminotransferase class V-fold PLP-dependent enzyme [Chloroflexi bacterium]|nr:aminotransferase class V-fold PLP-dependent enzyme [Chloroflexota bacterium]
MVQTTATPAAGREARPEAASVYEGLGLRPIINANAALTRLGGSLMPAPVLDAMRAAADSFVDMHHLQEAVSQRLAALTRNEAALACAGGSAGLVLSALGCMTGRDMRAVARLIDEGPGALPRREIVVHCAHRNPYDPALKLAGGRLVQIGNALQTFEWELETALSERTAAVFFFAGHHFARGALPLERVVAIAHTAGVPVVVDAAAQLPPPENLWRFTEMGADLAIFSGGKALRGPQASGLIVGRKELIEACALHASPHQRLGRPMKVGKEEMVGLLAAVEWFLQQDHAAIAARVERVTAGWIERLGSLPGVTASREFPGEAGQPFPRARVTFHPALGLDGLAVSRALLAGEPAIDVAVADDQSIYLNAEPLQSGEADVVLERLCAVVCASGLRGQPPEVQP